jgi:hypothetical protein
MAQYYSLERRHAIHATIPEHQFQRLAEIARQRRVSLATLMREMIGAYLGTVKPKE